MSTEEWEGFETHPPEWVDYNLETYPHIMSRAEQAEASAEEEILRTTEAQLISLAALRKARARRIRLPEQDLPKAA